MSAPLSWRHELGRLLRLAGPLIVNNLSIAGMQFADAVMAGRISARTLAGVAVGGSVWFFMFTIGLGILMAIAPIAARHHGAGRPELIGRYTRQGVWLALLFAIPVILAAHFLVPPLLTVIGIDEEFRGLTIDYVKAISWGAPGIFLFLALRFTTEGIGETRPIMYTSVFALACNVFLNWELMYGNLGFPAMGAKGCAIASAVTMWAIGGILTVYMLTHQRYEPLKLFSRIAPPRPAV
jgi:MATE family multidrug resistance protein